MKHLFESRISRGLMLLGAAVGVMSVGVWALDVHLNPPDWLIRIAFMKLAFLASAGLLAAGALVGRHARERGALPTSSPRAELGEGSAGPLRHYNDSVAPEVIEHRSPDNAP
jgi:hypothetical protein